MWGRRRSDSKGWTEAPIALAFGSTVTVVMGRTHSRFEKKMHFTKTAFSIFSHFDLSDVLEMGQIGDFRSGERV